MNRIFLKGIVYRAPRLYMGKSSWTFLRLYYAGPFGRGSIRAVAFKEVAERVVGAFAGVECPVEVLVIGVLNPNKYYAGGEGRIQHDIVIDDVVIPAPNEQDTCGPVYSDPSGSPLGDFEEV